MDLAEQAVGAEGHLSSMGLYSMARIVDSDRAIDIAINLGSARSLVIRCVAECSPADYCVLATMLMDGDFDRAILVYCDSEQPHLSDAIESWPISRFNELARSLARDSSA